MTVNVAAVVWGQGWPAAQPVAVQLEDVMMIFNIGADVLRAMSASIEVINVVLNVN